MFPVKLVKRYGVLSNLYTELKPIHRVFSKETTQRDRISDSILLFATISAVLNIAKNYLTNLKI